MLNSKIEKLELRVYELEKKLLESTVNSQKRINELKLFIEQIDKPVPIVQNDINDTTEALQRKIDYLTSVNEQMFKQNQRLRQYIEEAIEKKSILDQSSYYLTLKGCD